MIEKYEKNSKTWDSVGQMWKTPAPSSPKPTALFEGIALTLDGDVRLATSDEPETYCLSDFSRAVLQKAALAIPGILKTIDQERPILSQAQIEHTRKAFLGSEIDNAISVAQSYHAHPQAILKLKEALWWASQ